MHGYVFRSKGEYGIKRPYKALGSIGRQTGNEIHVYIKAPDCIYCVQSPVNILRSMLAANGINTLREAYLAGLDPTDPAARFVVQGQKQNSGLMLSWQPALPERNYTVLSSTNLAEGFIPLTVVSGPVNVLTNTPADHACFYRVLVQRAP